MDADQNFFYNQKGEAVAFNDSLIIPRFEERIRQDTAWVDSLTIDTIVEQKYTYFLPDNIVLRSFKSLLFHNTWLRANALLRINFLCIFGSGRFFACVERLEFRREGCSCDRKDIPQRHYSLLDTRLFALSARYTYVESELFVH